jgi:hypothetical protein
MSVILEGKTITVAEIRPPFDRPYVAKVGNEYHVWDRLGSRTATASRQLLDRFYQARERTPDIEVSWRIWTSRKRTEDPRGRHTDGLVIPPPKFFLDELRQTLEEESQLAQARASQATDPEYVERLNAYQQRYESFLEKIAHSHLLGRWYYWKEIERAWNPAPHPELMRYFSVVVTNNGNAPATGVSVQVKFPPWLFIFSDQPKMPDFFRPNPPSLDPPPPSPPRRPRDSQLPSWIGGPLPSIGGTRSQAPQPIRVQL